MDTKDTEGKAAETRSGPATGYATADDAIKALYDDSVVLAPRVESWLNIIVAEVLRLRALVSECADEIEPPPEWWRDETRCGYADRFKARMELRIKCVAVRESHNEQLSDAAKQAENINGDNK